MAILTPLDKLLAEVYHQEMGEQFLTYQEVMKRHEEDYEAMLSSWPYTPSEAALDDSQLYDPADESEDQDFGQEAQDFEDAGQLMYNEQYQYTDTHNIPHKNSMMPVVVVGHDFHEGEEDNAWNILRNGYALQFASADNQLLRILHQDMLDDFYNKYMATNKVGETPSFTIPDAQYPLSAITEPDIFHGLTSTKAGALLVKKTDLQGNELLIWVILLNPEQVSQVVSGMHGIQWDPLTGQEPSKQLDHETVDEISTKQMSNLVCLSAIQRKSIITVHEIRRLYGNDDNPLTSNGRWPYINVIQDREGRNSISNRIKPELTRIEIETLQWIETHVTRLPQAEVRKILAEANYSQALLNITQGVPDLEELRDRYLAHCEVRGETNVTIDEHFLEISKYRYIHTYPTHSAKSRTSPDKLHRLSM